MFKKYFSLCLCMLIFALVCSFWLLHQPWKKNTSFNVVNSNILNIPSYLDDINQAKQLFAQNTQKNQNLSNASLVGIIYNANNHNSKYVVLNVQNKNSIYRLNQEIPDIGTLIAIYPNYIEVETAQGYTQQIKLTEKQEIDININGNVNGNLDDVMNQIPNNQVPSSNSNGFNGFNNANEQNIPLAPPTPEVTPDQNATSTSIYPKQPIQAAPINPNIQ
jgi:hypothetical protein